MKRHSNQNRSIARRLLVLLLLLLALGVGLAAQQPKGSLPPPATPVTPEFARITDEVLEEVSRLIALPVKHPLKKSIRTREEIRAFVVEQLHEDHDPAKRYADQRALEKLGLIPKGFDLDGFLVELLTEQIAGLYDPKGKEFFIADWIELDGQRIVIAHELVHALQDQHFDLDPWLKAARPNDDAVTARDAVVEGSAIAGMIDYSLRNRGIGVRDLPNLEDFVRNQIGGDAPDSPQLARAPMFIRDSILFPYVAGVTFTQRVLKSDSGWEGFKRVFEKPPVSTQQVLHPDLYLAGVEPRPVDLPAVEALLPKGWKKLDDNVLGEFGLHGVLKQFLGEKRAEMLSPAWAGDRYAVYENGPSKEVLLVVRLRLDSEENALRFFGQYSEVLELKYTKREKLFRRPNFFSFQGDEGGVFLYCSGVQCLTVEGTDRKVFDRIVRGMDWPIAPAEPARTPKKATVATD